MMKNKKAFTLAEVLITLTIIGVIAAITIPNLMQNYKKQERITQIKEAYSIIKNAIKMAEAEHGSAYNWVQWTNATANEQRSSWPETYFIPYVKIQKVCGWGDNLKETGCFNSDAQNNGFFYGFDGNKTNLRLVYTMILQNGMHVGILESSGGGDKRFIVDVNGNKGPNKIASDVFSFAFSNGQKDVGQVFTGGLPPRFSSGYHMECNNTSYGYDCSRDIEKNGWQIPDNYPIKKF